MQWHPFVSKKRSVRGKNAILGAQCHQFVRQLFVLTMQVDLVDNEADAAHDPQFLYEIVSRALVGSRQLGGELERASLATDFARKAYCALARLMVPPDPHELAPFEQV